MDDFAKKAFDDALKAVSEDEKNAWFELTDGPGKYETIVMAVAMYVGIDKVNKLCGVAIEGKQTDVLAEYAHTLMLTGFHLGYHAALGDVKV